MWHVSFSCVQHPYEIFARCLLNCCGMNLMSHYILKLRPNLHCGVGFLVED